MTTAIALAFWTIVFFAGLAALLLGTGADDPRRNRDYVPPRSHHPDPFSFTGSSFR